MKPCLNPRVCGVEMHRDSTICQAGISKSSKSSKASLGAPAQASSRSGSGDQFEKLGEFKIYGMVDRPEITDSAENNYGIKHLLGAKNQDIIRPFEDEPEDIGPIDDLPEDEFRDIYGNGHCWSLAASLSEKLGNGVVFFGSEHDPIHVAAILDQEHYIDIYGVHKISEYSSDYGWKPLKGETEDILRQVMLDSANLEQQLSEENWMNEKYVFDSSEYQKEIYIQNWGLAEDAADRVLRENGIDDY